MRSQLESQPELQLWSHPEWQSELQNTVFIGTTTTGYMTLVTAAFARTRGRIAASKERPRVTRLYAREDARLAGADQLPEQPEASCRRARAPSILPVIADLCEGDDLSSNGTIQPWAVESVIARRTSIACRGPCIVQLKCTWLAPVVVVPIKYRVLHRPVESFE